MRLIDVKGAQDALPGKKDHKPLPYLVIPPDHELNDVMTHNNEVGFNSYRDHVEKVEVGCKIEELAKEIFQFWCPEKEWENQPNIVKDAYRKNAKSLSQNSHKFLTLKKGE